MRIAYVYDAVYPWETGGVQKRVWELARRLAGNHDVHWYGLKYWDGPAVVTRDGVRLHGVMDPPEFYVNGRRSISEAIRYSARLVRPFLNERFDVIDCQEFPFFPAFSSKLQSIVRGATLVVTWHEVWDDYWDEYLGRTAVFGKAVERLTTLLPDEHVAVSERTRRDLDRLGVPGAALVPNGIEMAEIESVTAADRTVDVLYAGRLIPEKNVDLLVRAVDELRQEMPDLRCVIVGDGPERPRIASLVDDLGLESNVELPGTIADYEDVLALMKTAGVFVLPSQREGFGICALEALACGTPVVTNDHGRNAAQALVEDGVTGAVCTPDVEAVADGIRRARQLDTASACVASAREYEWDRIADRTERLYRRVAGESDREDRRDRDRPEIRA
jgi:glycosyltransferase involved in cell wall biosynthesis